jgi:hypothetical protein
VSDKLNNIVERIDAGDLRPRTHAVVGHLAEQLTLSALGAELVKAFKEGRSVGDNTLLSGLWTEIDDLPPEKQGGR